MRSADGLGWLAFAAWSALAWGRPAFAKPTPVSLEKTTEGWQLLRAGKPFRVKGAGGEGSLALLKAAGANATRTWGADDIGDLLDRAHAEGLAVTVGIWLGHERHGFDYTNADQVAKQYEEARQAVLRYRDHPALLIWGVGNEMEGFEKGDNAAVWSAVNNIAAMVKKLDPHHPTMTVLAEIGGDRVKNVHRLCPDIDIVGVNAYGGVQSLPARYRAAGGTKPYLVTETGPPGAWEVSKTAWGAPLEPTSTEKATYYSKAYEVLQADRELNLGSYMFLWSHKRESTATWFGMFLRDGRRTAAVDAMTKAWSGRAVPNQVPRIVKVGLKGPAQVAPGTTVNAYAFATDPENDRLSFAWRLEPEDKKMMTGGDKQPEPAPIEGAIAQPNQKQVAVKLPVTPGKYRLYVTVGDSHDGVAVANIPLRVLGEAALADSPRLELPLSIYDEGGKTTAYVPSGYMGDHDKISMNAASTDDPKVGETCLEVRFAGPDGWGGVVWQHPANDWGDKPGGFDWTGAKTLSFWVRGKLGGERVKFGYGLIGEDKPFHDTDRDEKDEVELSQAWKQIRFDLGGRNLSRIKSGFYWVAAGQGGPLEFYLDDIRVE